MDFFQPWHLVVLAVVFAFLFFGWNKLPDMSRSVGRSLRIFKTEIKGMAEDDKARDTAKAEPQAIAAPEPAKADMVKNVAANAARPSPRPSPNGHSQTPNA